MGNLQGSDKGKNSGKAGKGGVPKTKKSPVKDLFKHQVPGSGAAVGTGAGKKVQAQKPAEDPVPTQQAVTASGGGGGNDRTTSCASPGGGAGAVFVTDSWRQVGKLQQSLESKVEVRVSPTEETSSSDSVFTDPLVTPLCSLGSDYSDGKECGECRREEDDVTLTMETSEDEESTPVAGKRRLHSHSLDRLDEEAETPGTGKARTSETKTAFTVVRHRKVELPPTKLSEQCLINAAGKDAGSDFRRHSSVSDVPLDSNVLRKVASLTLDKATLEQKISKPKFVPEKLDFQLYEKFEGNNESNSKI
ncbi:hypothetical protein J6590_061598 [Homalodisca vitripennis]|nr:hypothetical protein J6590_061598 [Homalodisca vitripennis]